MTKLLNHAAGDMFTWSGKTINLANLTPDDIDIRDIAHGLSHHASRWLNSGPFFYPVAWHSMRVADQVPAPFKIEALLHDASEAYLCDLPKWIKALLPDYQRLESQVMGVIAERFGFVWPMSDAVKKADHARLEYEHIMVVQMQRNDCPYDNVAVEEMFVNEFLRCWK